MIDNVKDFLSMLEHQYGARTAFITREQDNSSQEITFNEFCKQVYTQADVLSDLLKEERRIAIAAENSYEWIVHYWSIMVLGKCAVPVDPELPWQELDARLEKLGVHKIFVGKTEIDTNLEKYTMSLCNNEVDMKIFDLGNKDFADLESTILFSTGTTGDAKGVRLSQRNIVSAYIPDTVDRVEVFLPALPFYHALTINGMITALYYGCKTCVGHGPQYMQKDIRFFNPEMVLVTPIYLNYFCQKLNRSSSNTTNFSKLWGKNLVYFLTGGASPQRKTLETLIANGVRILSSYGSSETFDIARGEIGAEENYAGIIDPKMNITTMDDEIVVKGPTVFMGYTVDHKSPIKDGWYHTGDLGYIDEEGRLFLTGRKKNLIILSNGKNVSPEYLEKKLLKIPAVTEVIVYGANDQICAEIYLGGNDGEAVRDDVRSAIREMNRELPTYYQIQRVVFRDTAFEYTGIGKIKRIRGDQA